MFGTLRRLGGKAAVLFRPQLKPQASLPKPHRLIPLIHAAFGTPMRFIVYHGANHPHEYPHRACRTKIKGRKDKSLKARANRRKAKRKARAR